MSLDVYLYSRDKVKKECIYCGSEYEEDEELFSANITHNLTEMASKAGIYEALWRPYMLDSNDKKFEDYNEELAFEETHEYFAKDIIDVLEKGLENLISKPEYFKQFNASNGWGIYEHFVPFVEKYLEACRKYPEAKIIVSR